MKLKVVFKIKRDQLDQVNYKTRIALKGYSQQAGIDYDLTYAPTLSNNSFFMIIEFAVIHDWETDAYDISYAYPQAEPDRQLFVEVSEDLIQLGLNTSRYNELMTNMYETKQGGRNYSLFSNKIMLDYGLTRSDVALSLPVY